MRGLVRMAKRDPAMRVLATSIIQNCPPKAWATEIRALFNFVRENVRYTLDTNDIEVIQGPAQTLQLGTGDCDDMCILLVSLLECCGHPAWFLALEFSNSGSFTHVIVQTTGAGETKVFSLDPTEDEPMGWFPPGVTQTMRCDI